MKPQRGAGPTHQMTSSGRAPPPSSRSPALTDSPTLTDQETSTAIWVLVSPSPRASTRPLAEVGVSIYTDPGRSSSPTISRCAGEYARGSLS